MIVNALLLSSTECVSAGWDCKVIVWDIGSLKKKAEIPCQYYINCLSWMDKEKKMALAGGKNGYLVLLQL